MYMLWRDTMGKNVLVSGVNDLQSQRPDIAKEFDVKENGITPNKVFVHSNLSYKWICSTPGCNYKWEALVSNRTKSKKPGCPICKNKILISGRNDLETKFPEIASEWCYKLNKCKPAEIFPNTSKKFYWVCKNCNEIYFASPNSRCRKNGTGCPFCSGRKPIYGKNDFETYCKKNNMLYLLDEWNDERNPQNFTYSSGISVKWKCKNGHEWKAAIYSRINGNGCEKCSSKGKSFPETIISYYLEKTFGFSVIRNYKFDIDNMEYDIFLPKYNIAIEYDGVVYHKQRYDKDLNKNIISQKNEITLIRIREEGLKKLKGSICIKSGYYKHDYLYMNDVMKQLQQYLNILLDKTFNFVFDIKKDLIQIKNYEEKYNKDNSFGHLYPQYVKFWDKNKNGNITPYMISKGEETKYYWICEFGHSFKASPYYIRQGHWCKECAKKRVASSKMKPVCQYDLNDNLIAEYSSIKEAVTKTGIKKISAVCNGNRKTAGGYKFRFK